jgi:hypothetical protein
MARFRITVAAVLIFVLTGVSFYNAPAYSAATPHVTATALVREWGVYVRGEGGCWNYMGKSEKLVTRVQLYHDSWSSSWPRTQSSALTIANNKPLNYQDAWHPDRAKNKYRAEVDCLMWTGETWKVMAAAHATITTKG